MKAKKKEKRKISRTSLRFAVIIGVCGLAIMAIINFVGIILMNRVVFMAFSEFQEGIGDEVINFADDKNLREGLELMAKYAAGEATQEDLNEYKENTDYRQLLTNMTSFRKNMYVVKELSIVYIDQDMIAECDPNDIDLKTWEPVYYLADTFTEDDTHHSMGERSTLENCDGSISESDLSRLDSEVEMDDDGSFKTYCGVNKTFFPTEGFGYCPIVMSHKVIGFVQVIMGASWISHSLFVVNIALFAGGLLVTLLFVWLAVLHVRATISQPLQLLEDEAKSFVENDTRLISTNLQKIKTKDEIQSLAETILRMEKDIHSYIENLEHVTAEKERIGAELDIAKRIQAAMLPAITEEIKERREFNIAALMTPAKEVGGDFYDFFFIDEDHLAMIIADVSGKGVPAAMFMAITKVMLENCAKRCDGSPARILQEVNEQITVNNKAEMFITVWIAIIDLKTGQGLAANAGHEHPVRKNADGEYELVKYRHSPVLGAMEGIRYREHAFSMKKGDRLLVYTDGVAEATSADEELYGTDRMLHFLNENKDIALTDLPAALKENVDQFAEGENQFDDLTILVFDYLGPED